MDLRDCRRQIDRIDREIVELYQERMDIMEKVAAWKAAQNLPVEDPAREREKIEQIREMVVSEDDRQGAEELFSLLMTLARRKQEKILAGNRA